MEKEVNNNIEYKIRACEHKDIPLVININERTLPENYPLFFYKQILERYSEAFYLAYKDSNPTDLLGYIMWRTENGPSAFQLKQVKKGHLVSLAVLPEYRRLGVASTLLEKTMGIVEEYRIAEFVLEVRVSNSAAIRLYNDAFGFEKIKIISHYYRDGEDAFYMSKNVASNTYVQGSKDMSEQEIIDYYREKKKKYLCFRCPNCDSLILKSLKYSLVGSVSPRDDRTLNCAYCGNEISLYKISVGKYDVE